MPDFMALSKQLGDLVTRKNKAYGNSVTSVPQVLAIYYPDGIKPAQYSDAAGLIRMLDKMSRIAQHEKAGDDKGGESPWMDIAGYGLVQWANTAPQDSLNSPSRHAGKMNDRGGTCTATQCLMKCTECYHPCGEHSDNGEDCLECRDIHPGLPECTGFKSA